MALLADKADCGSPNTSYTHAGSMSLSRSGDTLSVSYRLRGGIPNSQYTVELWVAPRNFFQTLGVVTTNNRGVARSDFTANVAGQTQFFVYGHDGTVNETVTATLG